MSFAAKVKEELCRTHTEEICCVRAELTGMLSFAAKITGGSILLSTENPCVAQRLGESIQRMYRAQARLHVSKSGIYRVALEGDSAMMVLRDTRLHTTPLRLGSDIVRKECCKRSYLRGAFLGSGSVSAPDKAYHLELVTGYYAISRDAIPVWQYFGLLPGRIIRKGNHVFYLKDSEQISDLMALMGAHTQMMELLNVKIEKEVRNDTNRRVNCETANTKKRAGAAVAQMRAIRLLDRGLGLSNLPPQLEEVARLRLNDPEAPLSELAAALGITKSGVNHRMRKLIAMAKDFHTNS